MQKHSSLRTNNTTSMGIDISFFAPMKNKITKVMETPKDVTLEEVLTLINSAFETFSSMDLWRLNNRFHVVDTDGKNYRFTKVGGAILTLVPKCSTYRPEKNIT